MLLKIRKTWYMVIAVAIAAAMIVSVIGCASVDSPPGSPGQPGNPGYPGDIGLLEGPGDPGVNGKMGPRTERGTPGLAAPAATAMPAVLQNPVAVERQVIQTVVVKEVVEVAREEVVVQTVVVEREVQAMPAEMPAATSQPSSPQTHPGGKRRQHQSSPSSQGRTPHTTTFQDYQRSSFVDTSYDDTSTFSLDTDRTSFQLALNWARAGYDVAPVSVRAEEWINAFDYGYESPLHNDTFSIVADVFEHPLENGRHMARIAFQAPSSDSNKPLNVTLVLDASGSMGDGNRVEIARTAATRIARSMSNQDRISIVHFTDNVIDHFTVEDAHPDDRRVSDSIQSLAPHASTNVQAGINLGVRLADKMRRARPEYLNYVILMSDGVANVDATDPFAILESAYDPDAGNPLRMISIGVGIDNYNDVLLEQLAQHGNGWYRYLSNPDEARSLFARERWLTLSSPVADQTRAQVKWNPEYVQSWRLIGYENRVTSDQSFTQPLKKFAEIPSGAATTVFYELELTDRALSGARGPRLGTVELRWVDPENGNSNSQHGVIERRGDIRDDMLKFGSIVALASDLYSGLDDLRGEAGYEVHRRLNRLNEQLHGIRSPFSETVAFGDFAYLLSRITEDVPPEKATGYSR